MIRWLRDRLAKREYNKFVKAQKEADEKEFNKRMKKKCNFLHIDESGIPLCGLTRGNFKVAHCTGDNCIFMQILRRLR